MTFLTICQELTSECGITGGTLPASVVGQSGELGRIVGWVRQAWVDIQRASRNWTFMGESFDQVIPAGTQMLDVSNPPINVTDVLTWDESSFRIGTTVNHVDETNLVYQVYEVFRDQYLTGPIVNGRPSIFTINRAGYVEWNAYTDQDYKLRADYRRKIQRLTLDADVPYLPDDYVDVIKWKALTYYAQHEEAGSLLATATANYKQAMSDLRRNCLPRMVWGASLA